jgi:molybdate transport system regulatory protein
MLITAEVKAPWIQLYKNESVPVCSADNIFHETVSQITKNRVTAEIAVQLADGTELCAIITEKTRQQMGIQKQDTLWAFFDAFAVVLHID